ncbi:MAG TPA: GIY-YIG nuclease family protein [Candidatus Sericytochromatia bacterium]|jgi:hypothetical protein
MWLKFGVSSDNALVCIEDIPSGKTSLTCLYCGGGLTAKKGRIKEHHFAHTQETCRPVASRVAYRDFPALPLYDNFNIQLAGFELEELKVFWLNYGVRNEGIFVKPSFKLILSKLLAWNERGFYEFTPFGKIPVGALPLRLFNEVQEPKLLEKLAKLEQAAQRAQLINSQYLSEKVADFRIYRAQLKQILLNNLYFLQIKAGRKLLHKIGVTKRPIEERVIEVQRDLAAHYKRVDIQVLGVWKHRGNVELYFKHRYKDFNYRIGSLTEYFKLADVEAVWDDLRQMPPKVLAPVELDVLSENFISSLCRH